MPIPCGYAAQLMGASVFAPQDDVIAVRYQGEWVLARWQATADGYQGFVPVTAKYIGGGRITSINPPRIRRGSPAPDTDLGKLNGAGNDAGALARSVGFQGDKTREQFRNYALILSNDQGITDCEKLARLVHKALQLQPQVTLFKGEIIGNNRAVVGLLLGGLTDYSGYGFLGGTSPSDPNYRVGVFKNDPHYGGGFEHGPGGHGSTGFKPQFTDPSNQVRHFVGWFAAGFSYGNLSRVQEELYRQEGGNRNPQDADVGLGLAAIEMGASFGSQRDQLVQDIWHKICGGAGQLTIP